MLSLILDTSTELCLIALAKGPHIIAQEVFPHRNLLSKNLLPSIQNLLQKHALSPKDLKAIALGIGPGSYTGTRLGASVGKSLAFALNLPLKTFSSLLAFLPSREGTFASLLPTRAGAFFLLKGKISASAIHPESPLLLSPQELAQAVADVDFFVAPSGTPEMKGRPLFLPEPNFQTLRLYLAQCPTIAPEDAEVLYLHNPF